MIVYIDNIDYIGDAITTPDFQQDIITATPFIDNINTLAPFIDNINTLDPFIDNVNTLDPFIDDVDYIRNVNTLDPFIDNINTLDPFIDNVNTLDPFIENVDYQQDIITTTDFQQDIITTTDFQQDIITTPDFQQDIITTPDFQQDIITETDFQQDIITTIDFQQDTITTPAFQQDIITETPFIENVDYQQDIITTTDFIDNINTLSPFIENVNTLAPFIENVEYTQNLDFIGDFTAVGSVINYVGGDAGTDVGTGTETIETYTLYCKVNDDFGWSIGVQTQSGPKYVVAEGDTFTITFDRTDTSSAETVYLSINTVNGELGTAVDADLDGTGSETARTQHTIGAGFTGSTVTKTVTEDVILEADDEYFWVELWDSSTGGNRIATSQAIYIQDVVPQPDASISFSSIVKSQLGQSAPSSFDILEPGFRLSSDGNVAFAGQGEFYRVPPPTAGDLVDDWLPQADKGAGVGNDYEVRITQVLGTITGTTSGYVSLGTSRTVLGRTNQANSNNQQTDQVRIEIRKVGSGTNDVNVVISLESDTQR